MKKQSLRIKEWIQDALIGEVYSNLLAVSYDFDRSHDLTLFFYTKDDVCEYDLEKADLILTNILSNTSSENDIRLSKIKHHKLNKNYSEVIGTMVFAKEISY